MIMNQMDNGICVQLTIVSSIENIVQTNNNECYQIDQLFGNVDYYFFICFIVINYRISWLKNKNIWTFILIDISIIGPI